MTLTDFIALFTPVEWTSYMYWQMEGQAALWPPFVSAFIVKRIVDHDDFQTIVDSMLSVGEGLVITQERHDEVMLSQPA
jgi:hypothetical protein